MKKQNAPSETINQKFLRIRKNLGRWAHSRGTSTGNGDCVRCIPHNYFRLLDLSSDISSVAAADSLQLLLLVTLAKLGTRVKFRSCREVLEGFEKEGTKG